MNSKIKKNVPCSLQVWDGCDVILDETGLYFTNREELLEYLDEHLPNYRSEMLEYYLTQSIPYSGIVTDIHLAHTIR